MQVESQKPNVFLQTELAHLFMITQVLETPGLQRCTVTSELTGQRFIIQQNKNPQHGQNKHRAFQVNGLKYSGASEAVLVIMCPKDYVCHVVHSVKFILKLNVA